MKIVIVGNSGSGKTWLANPLATVYFAPIVHLDDLFWGPGGFDKQRSRDEIMSLIEQSQSRSTWIVEGVFGELAAEYISAATAFVWLDLDWYVCKARLERRGSESNTHMPRAQSQAGLAQLIEWARSITTERTADLVMVMRRCFRPLREFASVFKVRLRLLRS